ncbi:MAG: hypothetical protein VW907_02905 [Opitutae bacterium]
MSYLTELDADGKPSFTELDISALVKIYGKESTSLPQPESGELISELGNFDLNQSWKAPVLTMSLNNGQDLMEPSTNESANIYYLLLERSDGYIGEEATVFLDWDFSENLYWDYKESDEGVESWLDLRFKSAVYPSSVVFDQNISTVQLTIEVYKSDYSEDEDEWIEVSARDQITSPGYFREMPTALRLKVLEYEFSNSNPSGIVFIDGNLTVGNTIQAVQNLSDPDGLGTLYYQWYADDVMIEGEHSSLLTLTESFQGKAVSVAISYTDGMGNQEIIYSSKSASVQPANKIQNGWMWFTHYPWVYSDKESGWLYFRPVGTKLMIFNANKNEWKELDSP